MESKTLTHQFVRIIVRNTKVHVINKIVLLNLTMRGGKRGYP
jgi:hypothetical protein